MNVSDSTPTSGPHHPPLRRFGYMLHTRDRDTAARLSAVSEALLAQAWAALGGSRGHG